MSKVNVCRVEYSHLWVLDNVKSSPPHRKLEVFDRKWRHVSCPPLRAQQACTGCSLLFVFIDAELFDYSKRVRLHVERGRNLGLRRKHSSTEATPPTRRHVLNGARGQSAALLSLGVSEEVSALRALRTSQTGETEGHGGTVWVSGGTPRQRRTPGGGSFTDRNSGGVG
ncbi:hypothetical protein EYF80_028510 [Liparis tanakae]|uniref:Uncharacterized protein n=1 Tax=Liparis tanakae TaxID=230148 RepID=A0A4Z2H5Z6_9TELE|nr:hypothetical protein EYF80_028510 [Liparis tanakae]